MIKRNFNALLCKIYSYQIAVLMCGGTFPLTYVYPEDMRATADSLSLIPDIGQILVLTILYEIAYIKRCESVQKFASYSRLIKYKAESVGNNFGTQGIK